MKCNGETFLEGERGPRLPGRGRSSTRGGLALRDETSGVPPGVFQSLLRRFGARLCQGFRPVVAKSKEGLPCLLGCYPSGRGLRLLLAMCSVPAARCLLVKHPALPSASLWRYHTAMSRRRVVSVLTLGCKLNLADSEAIARRLGAEGYDVVDSMCEADAVVVNTCSVTHAADRKSRRLIRAARRLSPSAPVAVTGCFPRSVGADAVEALGADFVGGTSEEDQAQLVARLIAAAPPLPGASQKNMPQLHTRAFVKAQEGCNDVCAFCIVPRTRGREISRSIDAVAQDVEAAHVRGAREVVLTGTQLGAWGRDLPEPLGPFDLIAGVLARTEMPRLRFSSLQPQDITPGLVSLWDDPRLMPHFHLALQSGADPVLARMRRRYDSAAYRGALDRIRTAVPDAAVTTDVIAGFPGERDEDFDSTLALCEEAAFARIHAFPYSPRSRTAAAGMTNQVPVEVRKERMGRLLALGKDLAVAFRARFSGEIRPVLWEDSRMTEEGVRWHGLTDNYCSVYAESTDDLTGRITLAALRGPFADGLAADLGSSV